MCDSWDSWDVDDSVDLYDSPTVDGNKKRAVILGIVLVVAAILIALTIVGCAATPPAADLPPVGQYQSVPGSSGLIVTDTRTAESWIVMPEGVVSLGTPQNPTLDATPRKGFHAPKQVEELPDGVSLGMK